MTFFERLHAMLWVRIHWVEAYLAHHRDDQFSFNFHESKMRGYENALSKDDVMRRFA